MVVKQSSQRILYVSSIVWLMGFSLLTAADVSIAMSLPIPSRDVSGVLAWIEQHRIALQMADEMLAFGASMLLAIVVVLYGKYRERHPIGMSVVLALGVVMAIGAFHAMMALGRLVYLVNGLPITSETSILSASQLFAGLHWMALALAAYVIAVAIITKSRMIILTSVCVALLKIVGTYYADEVSVPLTVVSEVALFGWSIMMAVWISRKKFEMQVTS
ncbi:MAG: hypothetical protein Q3991_07265 [Rothia sp. (in: high G+C Gram-positive bacteria)]|uniref:hypothetical protein n=1 Tax=Rothia sp. (in: high G+C Gram-positive bacteria) TaxID=1885016 RepID=UPI0026DB61DE|nr:hypothetical protein [Rothia sp. (in: high G+C Gram-positive bacteria)]MDO4884732.1 hypothetical protein [Rothia sp. (in: high G+C Gram-positive bacteria)]